LFYEQLRGARSTCVEGHREVWLGRAGHGTAWRHLRALTLVLLVLLLASPLSTGDRGLWLSLTTAPALLDAPAAWLPAEHSTLLPDRPGRALTSARVEQTGTGKRLVTPGLIWVASVGDGWSDADAAPAQALHALFAARPDPRAPPA
jgi:hypothetical protein